MYNKVIDKKLQNLLDSLIKDLECKGFSNKEATKAAFNYIGKATTMEQHLEYCKNIEEYNQRHK